jgi:hypothetical protein
MTDSFDTVQIAISGVQGRAREAVDTLQRLLCVDLSSEVEAKIARHLVEHGSLEAGDKTALIELIVAEAERGMARSPVPALLQTGVLVAFAHWVVPILNIVIVPFWLVLVAIPLFVVLHVNRVKRVHVTRALALMAKSDHLGLGS